jgi:Flp pilus assembly protein TadG
MECRMSLRVPTLLYRFASTRRRSGALGRRGEALVGFAIVAPVFLTLMLGVMEVGFDLFVQGSLDAAVKQAARSVQTGTFTGYAGETSSAFANVAVCPFLGGWLSCSQIRVGVAPVATGDTYYNNTSTLTLAAADAGAICTGQAGKPMLIQVWYLGPTFVGLLIPSLTTTYNGSVYHITSVSAGFVNEYGIVGQSGC